MAKKLFRILSIIILMCIMSIYISPVVIAEKNEILENINIKTAIDEDGKDICNNNIIDEVVENYQNDQYDVKDDKVTKDNIKLNDVKTAETTNNNEVDEDNISDNTSKLSVAYKVFIDGQQMSKWKFNNDLSGTENQGISLNGIKIVLTNAPIGAGIEYQVLEETITGERKWSEWKKDGELAGFEENSRNIYAIKIRLINMENYSVEYRIHRRYQGWENDYVSDGEIAGTEYTNSKLEGIKIRIIPKITKSIGLQYKGYTEKSGYQEWIKNGALSGTENQGISLNGIKIALTNAPIGAGIEYQVLEETITGERKWSEWRKDGELAGFEENNRNIYAIKIRLINMENYSVEYRIHRRYQGWENDYVSDGEIAGTEYTNSKLEGIKIRIIPKITKSIGLQYKGYTEKSGYQEWTKNGALSGTENQGISLNGIKIALTNAPIGAGIEYQVLEETITGERKWSEWRKDGELAGFEENSRNIYAIKIRLINMENYSVEYRIHRRYQGWENDYVSDGEIAGTEYTNSKLEGIKIRIIPKITKSIGLQYKGYTEKSGYQEWTKNGALSGTENQGISLNGIKIALTNAPTGAGIEYQVLEEAITGERKWSEWKKDGELAGFEEHNRNIYAIKIRLINMENYSVKYRIHRQYQGWEYLWKWDGLIAGTENTNSKLEGIQIVITNKIKIKQGIDVSEFNGDINWNLVSQTQDFAIIRIGYRGYLRPRIVMDSKFLKNIQGAQSAGMTCGIYFFSQAITEAEAIEEANWILNTIAGYSIDYPIVFDTEWANENHSGRADYLSKEERTKVAKAFLDTIKNRGYMPMLYANPDWLYNYLDMSQLIAYDVWLAHYTGDIDKTSYYSGSYTMWQYTSEGKVNGINGNVDLDILYKNY